VHQVLNRTLPKRQRAEARYELQWVGAAVLVLAASLTIPRHPAVLDNGSRSPMTDDAALAIPVDARVALTPLELRKLEPAAFGD
jgi:hypothetical protein